MSAAREKTDVNQHGEATRPGGRPKPDDAVESALETFLAGRRVDMQRLAATLDIAPATLYRWFGTRGDLLELVCERLARTMSDEACAAAAGDGDELVLDFARRLAVSTGELPATRAFARREPQLALRIYLAEHGAVHKVLAQYVRAMIDRARGPHGATVGAEQIDLMVQVATALVWATFMIGDEARVDRAVDVIRLVLAAGD